MAEDLCRACLEQSGLCARHAPSILPQRAIPPWVKLIGTSHLEQLRIVGDRDPIAVARAKRRELRKANRRGLAGLLAHLHTA